MSPCVALSTRHWDDCLLMPSTLARISSQQPMRKCVCKPFSQKPMAGTSCWVHCYQTSRRKFSRGLGNRHVVAAQGEEPSSGSPGEFFDGEPEFYKSGGRRTRLATRVITIPKRIDLYFAGNWWRQALWSFVAFGIGYYSANVVSLSFGALAINDVVAAVLTVAFCEVVSIWYYSAPRKTLRLVFLNAFKLGVIAALIADALKLQG